MEGNAAGVCLKEMYCHQKRAESSCSGVEPGTEWLRQCLQELFEREHFQLQQKVLMKYLTPVLELTAAQKIDS